MRQPPFQAEDTADQPPPASLCGGSTDCVWRHSTRSRDFEATAVLILVLCALICALALSAGIRCFLRRGQRCQRHQPPQPPLPLDESREAPRVAPVAYSLEIKPKLAGGEAECAICLSEFMDGEEIRILEECSHGFHAKCIHKWLCTHSSCPTCRHSCYSSSLPSSGGGARPAIHPQVVVHPLVLSQLPPQLLPFVSSVL